MTTFYYAYQNSEHGSNLKKQGKQVHARWTEK